MKRWMTALGVGVGLASTLAAQDVEWRPIGTVKPVPPIVPVAHQPPAATTPMPPTGTPPSAKSNFTSSTEQPARISTAEPLLPPASSGLATSTPVVIPPNACVVGPSAAIAIAGPGEICGPTLELTATPWQPNRFWVRGEFLAWFTKTANGPALVTTTTAPFPTSNANGNVRLSALDSLGAIGVPGTQVLVTSEDLDDQFRPGFRVSAGWNFDPCGMAGIDGSFFYTGKQNNTVSIDSAQNPLLFRPFFSGTPLPGLPGTSGQFRELLSAVPIGLSGGANITQRSQFWGGDLNYRRCLWRDCALDADLFVGFRYLNLDEDLTIAESNAATRTINFTDDNNRVLFTIPAGSTFQLVDRFDTRNDFYGGQVGVDLNYRRDRWSFGIRPSVALGVTRQKVTIDGQFTQQFPGQPVETFTGGLLALNSNIGTHTSSVFSVVPEITARVGYQITDRLKVFVGYDFLYWSSVVRPGDQIDLVLDATRLPPPQPPHVLVPARPAVLFNQTDFWAMGLNTGLEYRW